MSDISAAPRASRRSKRRTVKCDCGCGQAPAKTTRLRLCQCTCGRKIRETREWLTAGPLSCPCGGELEPVCLLDRACLPGMADEIYAELGGRLCVSAVKRDAGILGAMRANARTPCRLEGCNRKRAREGVYCHVHADHEMPF